MNHLLTILYNHLRGLVKERHPYDDKLIGEMAEMFLDFDNEVIIKSVHALEKDNAAE